MNESIKKIVLAYSGGLDTSVILKWLVETYDCEVVAYAADVGQGKELTGLREKAMATGACEVYVEDLREEFVGDFVFPMLRAGAVYEGTYLLGTSIARPIIARRQVEIAEETGSDAVSHGATGKGNDQVRFELTFAALAPQLAVVAPWRTWDLNSRTKLFAFADKHGIEVPGTKEKSYSMDRNVLHVSYEGHDLEDPWSEPDDAMFLTTVSPEQAPDKAEYVEIDYEQGNPVAIDGKRLSPFELLSEANTVAGRNGVGRADIVENRYVGMKSRGVYETPGGTLLTTAHRALESLVMDREVMHLRDSLIPRYAEMVYYGYWFAPEREMLQAAIDQSQAQMNGTVRMKLYKGSAQVVGRRSDYSLYDPSLATFEEDDVYSQADAGGFIRLNALRLKIRQKLAQSKPG
ncbi:MAG TPA: argininosuccinate synthase [Deltaproteobacteria bacterium]|nr:argininosuccinate synthase [Candidatus Binatota bacterium]HIL12407.1 argininosuccinate synthase [Deltaproteobacteria bacterium]